MKGHLTEAEYDALERVVRPESDDELHARAVRMDAEETSRVRYPTGWCHDFNVRPSGGWAYAPTNPRDADARSRMTDLKRLRRRANLNLEELAERLQVDDAYLRRIERGERRPSLGVIERYANACGFHVEILFHRKDDFYVKRHWVKPRWKIYRERKLGREIWAR